jgi:hypothetical protein
VHGTGVACFALVHRFIVSVLPHPRVDRRVSLAKTVTTVELLFPNIIGV